MLSIQKTIRGYLGRKLMHQRRLAYEERYRCATCGRVDKKGGQYCVACGRKRPAVNFNQAQQNSPGSSSSLSPNNKHAHHHQQQHNSYGAGNQQNAPRQQAQQVATAPKFSVRDLQRER